MVRRMIASHTQETFSPTWHAKPRCATWRMRHSPSSQLARRRYPSNGDSSTSADTSRRKPTRRRIRWYPANRSNTFPNAPREAKYANIAKVKVTSLTRRPRPWLSPAGGGTRSIASNSFRLMGHAGEERRTVSAEDRTSSRSSQNSLRRHGWSSVQQKQNLQDIHVQPFPAPLFAVGAGHQYSPLQQ